ncbi:MAG: hypothetical protein GC154_14245 [bacterium]|nr:hypothetical protein [bacterium]
MGDQYIPIGQNLPVNEGYPTQTASPAQPQDASGVSFQDILSRQQNRATGGITPYSPVRSEPLPPQYQDLIRKQMENMPANVPQGDDLSQMILRNQMEYNQSKMAHDAARASEAAAPQLQQPVQPQTYSQAAAQGVGGGGAFGAALAKPYEPSQSAETAPATDQATETNAQTAMTTGAAEEKPTTTLRYRWTEEARPAANAKARTSASQTVITGDDQGPTDAFLGFFKNVGSFLTMGFYRPDGEAEPEGVERVVYPFKKLLWDAPKSLVYDTPASLIHAASSDESPAIENPAPSQPERSYVSLRRGAGSKPWLNRG